MRIALTGSSGFVGTALADSLRARGHTVVPLVRSENAPPGTCHWNPRTGAIDVAAFGRADAIVHLAGENIAGGRWSTARKQRIHDSRGPATRALCDALLRLAEPPRVLVCASAIGFYGDRGEQRLDASSAPGKGFVPDVVTAWERATLPFAVQGHRVVNLRIGMVLHPTGGALQRLLLPFRLGLGGRLGSGKQWLSWITRADLVAAIEFALRTESLAGPTLAVSPKPVTNREFTRVLGTVLCRPTMLPVPAFVLRLLLGEMADGLLLASQRCVPDGLTSAGFGFGDPDLEPALRRLLGDGRGHDRAGIPP